jgi:hypothetical protein
LSPNEDSDVVSDYETSGNEDEIELKNDQSSKVAYVNTDGESEAGLSTLTEGDSDFAEDSQANRERTRFVQKIRSMKRASIDKDTTREQRAEEQPLPAEQSKPAEVQPERDSVSQSQLDSFTQQTRPEVKTKARPKGKGILSQTKKFCKDNNVNSVNRLTHLQGIFNRYVALQKIHRTTLKENHELQKARSGAKSNLEELSMLRESNKERSLQIARLTLQNDTANSRLEYSSKILKDLEQENKALKETERKLREDALRKDEELRKKDIERTCKTDQYELHIPIRHGNVAGDILIFNLRQSYECYEDSSQQIQCLHLLLSQKDGKMNVFCRRRRKRQLPNAEENCLPPNLRVDRN